MPGSQTFSLLYGLWHTLVSGNAFRCNDGASLHDRVGLSLANLGSIFKRDFPQPFLSNQNMICSSVHDPSGPQATAANGAMPWEPSSSLCEQKKLKYTSRRA